MGLKQRHRWLLFGLLVLGCFGLAHTTATEGAPEGTVTRPLIAKWCGEGTIQAEYYDAGRYENITHTVKGTASGVFTFTFTTENLGTSGFRPVGEGIATLTATQESTYTGDVCNEKGCLSTDMHCTGNSQITVPLVVGARTKRSKMHDPLGLRFWSVDGDHRVTHPFTWSCTGPGTRFGLPEEKAHHVFLGFRSPEFVVAMPLKAYVST